MNQFIKKIKILLVDDIPEICELYQALLEDVGFEVMTCNSGNQAIDLLVKEPFDVVITDAQMEDGDAEYLMNNAPEPKPPFIVMSGHEDISRGRFIDMGATEMFPKPVIVKNLHSYINSLVQQRKIG
jgi:DNA-binding NtrC family response regulator